MNVIIHAPPRTGGFSMRFLLEQELEIPCFHVHYLANHYYYARKKKLWNLIEKRGREIFKIICTIRDPIARNLSEYARLEFIDRPEKPITPMRVEKGLHKRDGTDEEKFLAYIDHYRQHHFFGSELIPFWGIDVFKEPFDGAPYKIYDDKLLVIKNEALADWGCYAIDKFLDVTTKGQFPHKNVVPINRGWFPLSGAYIDAMFRDSFFPRWFYSEEEIERMKELWKTRTQRQ